MLSDTVSTPFAAGQISILAGSPPRLGGTPAPGTDGTRVDYLIQRAESDSVVAEYRRLRREAFVVEQHLFTRDDHDDIDDDPRTVVLVALDPDGTVLGGVRLAPCTPTDIGWWAGSRLVVRPGGRHLGAGPALIRAACAHAQAHGVLRFDALVQARHLSIFRRLGWVAATGVDHADSSVGGVEHIAMRWPIGAIQATADATKSFLGAALAPLRAQPGGLGPAGFTGDDGVPVPRSDVIAACDAIIPSMVERDPEWAGWCSVLVNLNDLSAMGADPTGLLDAVGAPSRSHLTRIIRGLAAAAAAWGVPVLGGHTQLGVPCALSVTALGHAADPIRAGGGRCGDEIRLTADLTGTWRRGYQGRQWDSTSGRGGTDLRAMGALMGAMRPAAAKDVSMAGTVGTLGMLAEASGTGAELDMASVPRPEGTDMGAWLSCFPGFAMISAGAVSPTPLPAGVVSTACGRLTSAPGVRLRWPDGELSTAIGAGVTGLGDA
ncbi:MSMEG_0567/sll0787 family protein [Williamsia sp. CHRR-6]|uniref:MSMEG_0567/sll0787 family protein n=1 Tax=Williamsia sp. CHRR-6 TaxID=2835871 RepID=UPI001BD94E5C|nr:MSMEG_0567/sll0787 family protein [Williamsia sp. CHRR-6]MBT0568085.1 GNAT family N-acetyltransferase [Williamsia sp. CHRR-6]